MPNGTGMEGHVFTDSEVHDLQRRLGELEQLLLAQPPKEPETTTELLSERGRTYGAFEDNARVTQAMFNAAMSGLNTGVLAHAHKEAIHMICHKISRITNGNPNHVDSWDDIAGYAKLVSNHIKGLPQPGTTREKTNPSMPIKYITNELDGSNIQDKANPPVKGS